MCDPFRLGAWFVDPAGREITDGTLQLSLSPRAMGVLKELARYGTRTVSREVLLDAVWQDVTVSDESLTQAVAELRRAFRSRADDDEIVKTVSKVGYRLTVDAIPCDVGSHNFADSSPAISMDAYCLVLEAHEQMVRAGEDALFLAIDLSREAVELSPGSAMANAAHAIILTHQGLYGGGDRQHLQAALTFAENAIAVGPNSSISHAAKSFALGTLGRFNEASSSMARSVLLDNRHGEAHYLAVRTAYAAGNQRAAVTLALRSAELVSDPPRPLFLAARAARQFDADLSKRIARRCVSELRHRLARDPDEPRSQYTLGPALGLSGQLDLASENMISTPTGHTPCPIHRVFGFATTNDDSRALDHLEKAIDEGYRDGNWLMREPTLESLRKSRRFHRLVRTLQAA